MVVMTRVVIIGGGPGGYEAAFTAARAGAHVTIVEELGLGGSAVLTDCVPSKTLIATAELMTISASSGALGLRVNDDEPKPGVVSVDLGVVNSRVRELASAQSTDIASQLEDLGVRIVHGRGRLAGPSVVVADLGRGGSEAIESDVVLVATGARPRVVADAEPDGERILTWDQLYNIESAPEHMIVVGSGVTGAEFASAYTSLGSKVTLVSSRDRVLPGEDADASQVLEDVFRRRGMNLLNQSRAQSVARHGDGVVVTLADGRTVEGSHCLMAVGSVPNTANMGLLEAGVALNDMGYIIADRVSRTSARGVYAAGDVTGVLMLASVAAAQGRIAMMHHLGEAVTPLHLDSVASNVFTDPEIATVGVTQQQIDEQGLDVHTVKMPLSTNARAKMQGIHDGFVKLYCRAGSGMVVGGVVVAPRASELIFPISMAVEQRLSVDHIAATFAVYPSLTGSVAEAARQLHQQRL